MAIHVPGLEKKSHHLSTVSHPNAPGETEARGAVGHPGRLRSLHAEINRMLTAQPLSKLFQINPCKILLCKYRAYLYTSTVCSYDLTKYLKEFHHNNCISSQMTDEGILRRLGRPTVGNEIHWPDAACHIQAFK